MASTDDAADRAAEPAWDDWKRVGRPALTALGAILVAGVGLRILAAFAWSPVISILADSWPYAIYAAGDPFADPQHPAGYPLALKAVGLLTREVEVVVFLQALGGVVSALLLFDGVRRMCGSPWPGVAGAAMVLLGADQLFLERAIMSEPLFAFTLCATVYATGRAMEVPERWYPWPIVAAVFASFAGMVKPHGLILLPLIAVALVFVKPRPWRPRLWPAVAFVTPVCALMLAFATANSISHGDFGIGPTPGWHMYARVAPIADCKQFDPPAGTEELCERTGREEREGVNFYLYDEESPAVELFGTIDSSEGKAADDKLGEFANQVILHEPRAYLESVWRDIKGYYLPNDWRGPTGGGTSLDGQLQWRRDSWSPLPDRTTEMGMEEFFNPFRVDRDHAAIEVLHDYQRVFRMGAVALTIATILILVGLLVGPRRNRLTVLVLGVGGLAMFILPTFGAIYAGRYSVPMAGLVIAAAIVGLMSGGEWIRGRLGRSSPGSPRPAS